MRRLEEGDHELIS
jgi:hypothetical protein